MQVPVSLDTSRPWFQPTWGRLSLALLLAAAGFLLSQEVALEWYPLNDPAPDITYLEISCAAGVAGNMEIRYDLASDGHRTIDTIRWPVTPTSKAYTYTFPLPDAPIVEMRVAPPPGGRTTISQMRIINRRNDEIRRFTCDLFRAERDILALSPTPAGWEIATAAGASAPSLRIELYSPIIPKGMDHRNLLRCLLSTGYLTLMLWILLLAVLFVFYRPVGWRDLAAHLAFMAAIAFLFALVGNRGLIRNFVHYARFQTPSIPPGPKLEFDLVSSGPSPAQVFWDRGRGINGEDSFRVEHESHHGQQTLRFPLPSGPFKALRFDPRDNPGTVLIRGIRLVDAGQRTLAVLPLDSLHPLRDIARIEAGPNGLLVETTPTGGDPITEFNAPAMELINRTLSQPFPP